MRFKPPTVRLPYYCGSCCLLAASPALCFCTAWVFYFRLPVPLIWALCPDHRGDSREPLGLVETALGRLALDDLLLLLHQLIKYSEP